MRKASHVSRSRTAGVYTTLSLNVNPCFDVFGIPAFTPFERQPKPIGHCDCMEANEAFFAEKLRPKDGGKFDSYNMVPTGVTADERCIHCGFQVCFMQPQNMDLLSHRREKGKSSKGGGSRGIGAVVGENVVTGEKVYFKSARAAQRAGYGNVSSAVLYGRLTGYKVTKGSRGDSITWRWSRG